MLVVADENIPGLDKLLPSGIELRRVSGRQLSPADLLGATALLVRSVTQVNASLLQGSEIRFVGSATAGLDHVDRDYLQAAGIAFAHAPGANANSVVEYVLAAIAAVDDYLERLRAGAFVGIVGYGHVGRLLAGRLQALDIGYLVCDPWLEQDSIPHASSLAEVLRCDVIALHPELTRRQPHPSHHLLGTEQLKQLQEGQLLINASRGGVIDNAALLDRLQQPCPPIAVLDVWEGEPQINAELLVTARLGTAHIAGYSLDSKLQATAMLVEAMGSALQLPSTGRAGVEKAAVTMAPGLQSTALLRSLALSHCPIKQDDTLLRQAVGEEDPAQAFDRLRRDYAPRHELRGHMVPADATPGQRALLLSLGCIDTAEIAL